MSIDLKKIIEQFPDCVTNGDKLKGILSDLYASEPKGVINTLVIIVKSGIAKEMQNTAVTDLDKARWKKQLEDDYALSEKVVEKCLDLWKTVFTKNLADFVIIDGVLVKYQGNDSTVVIPDGVTSIGDNAFSHCEKLAKITIPDSVTRIGDSAFFCCRSLTDITIPNGVTRIGNMAFWECSSLTSIMLPDSLTSIGDSAFGYCSSLVSVTIPNTVTSIDDNAFCGCINLTNVVYRGTKEQWNVLKKGELWNASISSDLVHCINGDAKNLVYYPAENFEI